jgi:hypothetical protein
MANTQALREAQRSIREAKTVKTLTIIALVFAPLAYTTSLLSMGDTYLPGSKDFSVYFKVAVPMVVVVFLGWSTIQLGYDDDGAWSTDTFWRGLLDMIDNFVGWIRRIARR